MADDKIRISWDDVQSRQVDERLKQQAAVNRTAQQTQQVFGGPRQLALPGISSLLYNTIVYMAFFGGIGGFCGWAAGEIVELLLPNPLYEFVTVFKAEKEIETLAHKGEISSADAQKQIDELYAKHGSNPYVAILKNRSLSEPERERQLMERLDKDKIRRFIQEFLYFAMVAAPLALWLSIGDQVMSRNWMGVLTCGAIAMTLGLVGGGIVSLFINKIYNLLGGGGDSSFGLQMFARASGWSLLGAFMTIAPGVVLRNFKRLAIGLGGGLLGGLIGGALFDPLGLVTNNAVVSRLVAIGAIGVLAGVGTGLIENVAKSGWLKVVAGLIAGKQFILYRNPTVVGSSPQCEVYLFKDPQVAPQHAAIYKVAGGFEIRRVNRDAETFVNGEAITRHRLRQGDQVQIGSTAFVFQEKHSTFES